MHSILKSLSGCVSGRAKLREICSRTNASLFPSFYQTSVRHLPSELKHEKKEIARWLLAMDFSHDEDDGDDEGNNDADRDLDADENVLHDEDGRGPH
jgi:hypothetical protein